MKHQPLFIAFEGIDGSGKSTQAKMLAQKLEEEGFKIHLTCEPTDNPIGTLIRKILKGEMEADHRTIAGLFVADRLHHLLNETDGILKKMEEGFTVVSDRYYFSSYAYQGAHVPLEWVIKANEQSAKILRPDLNVFIDISPEISMTRIHNRKNGKEIFETVENLNAVREKYFEAFDLLEDEEKIFIIDGNRNIETISIDVAAEIFKMSIVDGP